MSTKKLLQLIVVILVIFNILLSVQFKLLKNELEYSLTNVSAKTNIIETNESYWSSFIEIGYNLNGFDIGWLEVMDSNYITTEFSNHKQKSPILIVAFSETHCTSCIEGIVKIIKESMIPATHVQFIGSYSNYRDLEVFKKLNRVESTCLRIPHSTEGFNITDMPSPAASIVSESNIIDKFFLYDDGHIPVFKNYLENFRKENARLHN